MIHHERSVKIAASNGSVTVVVVVVFHIHFVLDDLLNVNALPQQSQYFGFVFFLDDLFDQLIQNRPGQMAGPSIETCQETVFFEGVFVLMIRRVFQKIGKFGQ